MTHGLVQLVQEVGQFLVQLHVHIVVLLAARAEGMAHTVGGADADGQQVGELVFA